MDDFHRMCEFSFVQIYRRSESTLGKALEPIEIRTRRLSSTLLAHSTHIRKIPGPSHVCVVTPRRSWLALHWYAILVVA